MLKHIDVKNMGKINLTPSEISNSDPTFNERGSSSFTIIRRPNKKNGGFNVLAVDEKGTAKLGIWASDASSVKDAVKELNRSLDKFAYGIGQMPWRSRNRRGSVDRFIKKFTESLGYGVGDIVSYLPLPGPFIGSVVNIDPKIRKIFVDWGGCGNIHQHDADEIQLVMVQDKKVRNQMKDNAIPRIAASIIGDIQTTEFLSDETADLLNKQFANELSNAALYNVLASWFENNGYPGFRAYFNRQAVGESDHAMRVYKFLVDAGVQVVFPIIGDQQYPNDLKGICRLFLQKEVETTKNWQIITESAKRGYNAAAIELCQWFMKEQMEEESSASILLQKVINEPMTNGIETIDALLRKEDPTFDIKTASMDRRS